MMLKHQKSRTARVVVTVALVMTMAIGALSLGPAPSADAVGAFDSELIDIVNAHRVSLGVAPLMEYPALSTAALNWSTTMVNGSTPPCGIEGFGSDDPANIGSQGLPPNSYAAAEIVGQTCGIIGLEAFTTDDRQETGNPLFIYAGQPVECDAEKMDWTSPQFRFCRWVNNTSQRAKIEDPIYSHVGSGTIQQTSGASTGTYATMRFAAVSCGGDPITVNIGGPALPTVGDDVILGTNGNDRINGLGGNDKICGLDGNDRLRGGPGDDDVWGGSGDDDILGGGGNDHLRGEAGNDLIKGQGGIDTLDGDSGDDRIDGGGATDILVGDAGKDIMNGGNGGDTISGGDGDDKLTGVTGPDALQGGEGNDDMFGGNGNDDLRGDGGFDKCSGNTGPADRAHAASCELTPGIEVLY